MANSIRFENTKIWRKDHEGQNGAFYTYTIGISKKNQDNSWSNAYMKVKFAQSAEAPEKIPNGAKADMEGFLTVDSYKTKDGKEVNQPMMMVMRLNIKDEERYEEVGSVDSFALASEECPF